MSSTRIPPPKKPARASAGTAKPPSASRATPPSPRRAAAPQEGTRESRGASVAVGARAPAFQLTSDTGEEIALDDLRGKWVILFFYPKDNTPGCTREAVAFQEASQRLAKRGAVVLGVSRDTVTSHASFKKKQGLSFPLLSDPSADTHKLYGAFGEKLMYGKKVIGAIRTTVLVRPDGTIAKIFSPVRVDGHADAVLAEIDTALASG